MSGLSYRDKMKAAVRRYDAAAADYFALDLRPDLGPVERGKIVRRYRTALDNLYFITGVS